MTCIVGLVDKDGTVWMGGDRCITGCANDLSTSRHPKVRAFDGYLVGIAGAMALVDLLHRGDWPPRGAEVDSMRWTLETLRPWVWARAKELDAFTERDGQPCLDGTLLVGVEGHVLELNSFGGVFEGEQPYMAIGAPPVALGVLWEICRVTGGIPYMSGAASVEAALKATAEFSKGVRGPFDILSLAKKDQPEGKPVDPATCRHVALAYVPSRDTMECVRCRKQGSSLEFGRMA